MKSPLHPVLRLLALLLTGVLFLSSGPVLLAQNARSVMSPAGGGAGGGRASAANLQNAGAASASLTATRAREVLQKSESALAAMRALQNNARNLMAASPHEGLKAGWLEPYAKNSEGTVKSGFDSGAADLSTWAGVDKQKTQLREGDQSVNIVQNQQSAYLYWKNFNVGSRTRINFDQSAGGNDAGKWIAFNKVMGAVSPSDIYGSITAQGQVYILNQNGILFRNGSQVNTRGLVASTLPINENLAGDALKEIKGRGIANNPDSQFLFSALQIPGNTKLKTDTFTPVVTGPIGDVVVERGASLSVPVNANNTGGLVALIGANVRNAGTVSTPNGQTILASGLQVGLTPHPSSDPSLRGLDVTVGRVADPEDRIEHRVKTVSESGAGRTRNDGIISAFRGNATMSGREVLQNGGIESSTSIDLNGRVDLLASYNAILNPKFGTKGEPAFTRDLQENTGLLKTGPGSVIRILPEWENASGMPNLPLSSLVAVTGRNISLGEGSILLVPGANISLNEKGEPISRSQTGSLLNEGVTLVAGKWSVLSGSPEFFLNRTEGRIDLGRDAAINAAGSTAVWVESSRNLLKLQLRGDELANSPLQRRDENIRGIDLIIDATLRGTFEGREWIGTPLGDVSGFVNLISRTVGELTTAGGSVSLSAGDAVSTAPGSVIDVSGGWIQYSGGSHSTSKLLYRGNLVDISQATPDRVYSQILTRGDRTIFGKTFKDVGATATIEQSSKWGQVKVFNSILDPTRPIWRPSYVSGASGGSISITAPSVALDGELLGNTVAGPRQVRDYDYLPLMNQRVLSTLPTFSSFTLDLSRQVAGSTIALSPYAPRVTFSSGSAKGGGVPFLLNVDGITANALPADRAGSVILSSDLLSRHGFGKKFSVTSRDGDIVLPSGVTLDAGPNGMVTLQGANLFIGGGIKAPGGDVSLQAYLTPLSLAYITFPNDLDRSESLSAIMTVNQDEGVLRRGEKVAVLGDPGAGEVTVYRADSTDAKVSGDLLTPLPAGRVALSSSARIDVAGSIVNELRGGQISPIVPNGGTVTIDGYSVDLEPGSEVDVSGGFYQGFRGGALYGDAGTIDLSAGQDTIHSTIHRGSLSLGGRLSGYAGVGSQGGSLAIKAPAFRISQDGASGNDGRVTQLPASFFDTGGFSSFSLTGVGLEMKNPNAFIPGVSVASGTTIRPRVKSQLFNSLGRSIFLPEGALATAPSLTLAASGLSDDGRTLILERDSDGNPIIEDGKPNYIRILSKDKTLIHGAVDVAKDSSIILNPQLLLTESFPSYRPGSLDIRAQKVSFAGTAIVPGGSISIKGQDRYPSFSDNPGPRVTLDLAPSAILSVAGNSLFSRDPLGIRSRHGTTLPGGSVSLSGNILARAGSVIDASGTSSTVDLLPHQLGIERKGDARTLLSPGVTSYRLDSAGGSISLVGSEALRSDAKLMARSGGKTASGGTLSISSGRYYVQSADALVTDLGLAISQSGAVIPEGFAPADGSAVELKFSNVEGIGPGGGHVAVTSFASGDFQNLTLGGNVLFSGPVNIAVPGLLKVASKGILSADSRTELSAKAVLLGTPFRLPLDPADFYRNDALNRTSAKPLAKPTSGKGELIVRSSRIDIGNLSLQGIGKASLDAPGGVIRGNGTFVMAGDLTLRAGIIYPVTGTDFRVVAFNHDDQGAAVSEGGKPGSITVLPGGSAPLPLTALGSLSLQADTITQSGMLAAPFGTITLGRNATEKSVTDPMSGLEAPVTSRIVLSDESVTTVSGIDRLTGVALSVPYGTSVDGASWTAPSEKLTDDDPPGTEITATGLSGKLVSVGGRDIVMKSGAVVDIRGGGSVTARQWVDGLGGKRDILNEASEDSSGFWAIIPGYADSFTPKGYGEEMVAEGTRIVLKQGAAGLPAGTYTLLPASYATQPGAYLLSRSTMTGLASALVKPDGTAVVPGTLMTGLDPGVEVPGITSLFELSSPGVIASKAEYRILTADTFFSGVPASGRTVDAGRLQMVANRSMNLEGSVATAAASGGRAAAIDIAATVPILLTGPSGPWETPAEGTIILDPAVPGSWKAGSLLIGGTRSITSAGEVKINPISESLTLDNDTRLEGAEVILAAAPRTHVVQKDETVASIADSLGVTDEDLLAANQLDAEAELTKGQILRIPGSHASVRLSDGSSIVSSGGASPSTLLLEGNGALLRVGHMEGIVRRTGFDPIATGIDGATPLASLVLGQGISVSGDGVTLDSTSETMVNASETTDNNLSPVVASSLRISSGLISVNGEDPGALTLSGSLLNGLNSSETLKSLSLTSYSTMILHDGSTIGSGNLESLVIRAAAINGTGGSASLKARNLTVNNGSGSSLPDSYAPPETIGGTLSITADTLSLGNGLLRIEGFEGMSATARDGISLSGKGGLSVAGNVEIKAPVIVGLGGAFTGIRADGTMVMDRVGNDPGALKEGLGASLTFAGSTVTALIPVLAPSGSISIESTTEVPETEVTLDLSALLDVGGRSQRFLGGVIKHTDAGVISLSSKNGDIKLNTRSDLNLSVSEEAKEAAVSAGTLRLTAPNGTLKMEGDPIRASKGKGGKEATFLADLGYYNSSEMVSDLNPLQVILKNLGFTEKQDIRIRSGDVTLADATARSFRLSADSGSITVTGTINASGETGGYIGLFAGQSLVLESRSVLDVRGKKLDAAGKGGLINLEAGSSPSAVIAPAGRGDTKDAFASDLSVIDLKFGSKLLLGVGDKDAGTVMLKAPQTTDATDLQINPIFSTIEKAESIIAVGNNRIDVNRIDKPEDKLGEGAVSIDPIKKYDEVKLPLPGQVVIGEEGGAYKLTTDTELYAQFIASEVALDEIADPATSPYWMRIAPVWDSQVDYAPGDKAVGTDGLIYTASETYPSDGTKPEPGNEDGAAAWTLDKDEGNYKALALRNAEAFDQAMLAPDRKNFAEAYADTIRVRPGQEIVNSTGGLLLNSDWDLSLARYGEHLYVLDDKGAPVDWSGSGPTDSTGYQMIGREPGLLSLRAAGDITFRGSLSDGFGDSVQPAADAGNGLLYSAPLIPLTARVVTEETDEGPVVKVSELVRQDSWSYRISAGSDFSSALPDSVSGSQGDIVIGIHGIPDRNKQTKQGILSESDQYQVMRTGTGDIALSAARDMKLLSPFASVYTAGTLVTKPTLDERFDLPVINFEKHDGVYPIGTLDDPYPVQYASGGGNIVIQAGRDVTRLNALLNEDGGFLYDPSGNLRLVADSSLQLPSNWLMRRGAVDSATGRFDTKDGEVLSTTWWVDYSNFFQDIGALGGGNIVMNAGRDIANVSASIPTSYRMRGKDDKGPIAPLIKGDEELGGGNLSVTAANNIDAGVYYVESGQGSLKAGGSIITNPTRDPAMPAVNGQDASTSEAWLPTTLFLGKGNFAVEAASDLKLGPVANVFLTPQSVNNSLWYKTYFSTYSSDSSVSSVSALSLAGNMTLAGYGATEGSGGAYPEPLLRLWYYQQMGDTTKETLASTKIPWIRSSEYQLESTLKPGVSAQLALAPPIFSGSALAGGITLQGNLTTAPAPTGDLSLVASGGINGMTSVGSYNGGSVWMSSSLNLSDVSPANIPGVASPLSLRSELSADKRETMEFYASKAPGYFTDVLSYRFTESGSYYGNQASIEAKQLLHDPTLLHKGDPDPLRLIASGGDISGLTLYSAKRAEVVASGDITDVGLYIQNLAETDISLISAGGSFRGYDPSSRVRASARALDLLALDDTLSQTAFPSGDVQISGPGTLQLLAGKDIDLGNFLRAPLIAQGDATIWNGLTSIGNARNPGLPFQGADMVVGAGLNLPRGLSTPNGLGLAEFTSEILKGEGGDLYLSELEATMTYSGHPFGKRLTAASFEPGSTDLTAEEKALAQLQLFYIVLRDTGRNYNKPDSPGYRSYKTGEKAIAALFANPGSGSIKAWERDIRTKNGGNISIVAPGGGITLSSISTGSTLTPPGIVTEAGGGINIFTKESVSLGIGRIFTLRGGDIMIWSDKGDIAAGASAKTVATVPPTRVLIDPQSGAVETDLAGLATGGGIGVLASVKDIPPGNVDLIAPTGVIDAGDAGIRSTGNLNLAATRVLNANNIAAGGTTSGAPPAPPPPAAPNVSGATAASAASAGNNASAQAATKPASDQPKEEAPSVISVEVLGYGGGDAPVEEDEAKKSAGGGAPPTQASL